MDKIKYSNDTYGDYKKIISEYDRSHDQQNPIGKDYEFWWRQSLKWSDLKAHNIDDHCSQFYEAIGYQKFRNESEYKDFRVPSLHLVKQLRL